MHVEHEEPGLEGDGVIRESLGIRDHRGIDGFLGRNHAFQPARFFDLYIAVHDHRQVGGYGIQEPGEARPVIQALLIFYKPNPALVSDIAEIGQVVIKGGVGGIVDNGYLMRVSRKLADRLDAERDGIPGLEAGYADGDRLHSALNALSRLSISASVSTTWLIWGRKLLRSIPPIQQIHFRQ